MFCLEHVGLKKKQFLPAVHAQRHIAPRVFEVRTSVRVSQCADEHILDVIGDI
jgi:hypothetical protein